MVEVKALACELCREHGLPLSRLSVSDVRREAAHRGIVASIGRTTVWRWLSDTAIKPWRYRSWLFPRDPNFRERAGRILDLYAGIWEGSPLGAADCVLSADEKTSIQARRRIHAPGAVGPRMPQRIEHEYQRKGAWAYMAAWDVRNARIHGRCESKTGIAPFRSLVAQVMSQEPYRSAPKVYWIVDNGSSHRGEACQQRLISEWPNIVVVHTPNHASWLNQIEIYFSILQRKALTPSDFRSLDELADRLLEFECYYAQSAKPFSWEYTRKDLEELLARLERNASEREAVA